MGIHMLTSTRLPGPSLVGGVPALSLCKRCMHRQVISNRPRRQCTAKSLGDVVLATGSATLMATTVANALIASGAGNSAEARSQRATTSMHGGLPAWSAYMPALNWAVFASKAWAAKQDPQGQGSAVPLYLVCAAFYGVPSLGFLMSGGADGLVPAMASSFLCLLHLQLEVKAVNASTAMEEWKDRVGSDVMSKAPPAVAGWVRSKLRERQQARQSSSSSSYNSQGSSSVVI
eukprot:CAMPEP_0202857846 /NCGR_PEP_ID=MMETSP1391-20130828/628_1 /ASSEMBLY_ACC=CAM_ASM_000867 /TAXON_ID=1034604 /ORGANISM="Chlamydomonas leiostraca, Strain SAG 11-49" /LENGTH=231 /DNA_ID=CAMNT_0049536703 /DNA_START=36 /DNA_END=731 /DNA_ORIENTATION=-